ncbi:MAG: radical SAM protein [Ardenticatenales bacterium]|nr:radical SAM protein [Ardenticatenales bacterium]
MHDVAADFLCHLPTPLQPLPWRGLPLDGKLLLFERNTGLNALLEGEETAHLHRLAPRTLLVAVTNACNLKCPFCYRPPEARSLWRYDSLMTFCEEAAAWGVLEVAFGGGEPMLFPRWGEFICELYERTPLAINFTTNGTLLTEPFLKQIAGRYGQIRLSLYEDNAWAETVALLVRCGARFGVNWLITPAALRTIEKTFAQLLSLGVRDVLFLSYKGNEFPEMHLSPDEARRFAAFLQRAHTALGGAVQLKLDVCWGESLAGVPSLFGTGDCAAADDFLSITSDRQVKPCSFHEVAVPFETIDDLQSYWQAQRAARLPAPLGGCARLPQRGLGEKGGVSHAIIPLAAIQQQPQR